MTDPNPEGPTNPDNPPLCPRCGNPHPSGPCPGATPTDKPPPGEG